MGLVARRGEGSIRGTMQFSIDAGEIRLLETAFTRKGIDYREVSSGPSYRIFSANLSGGGKQWFEVFQRRINSAHEIAGVKIPSSEAFPSESAFGTWAWTFQTLAQCEEKAQGINMHRSVAP